MSDGFWSIKAIWIPRSWWYNNANCAKKRLKMRTWWNVTLKSLNFCQKRGQTSKNTNLDSCCLRFLYWIPLILSTWFCSTPQVRTMRKENGKVWLRCFPHSAWHRKKNEKPAAFWQNRKKCLRPSPGERRSADMVVVKVIFSPYLRPTVKSPGDVGGPQPNPHEMAHNDEQRATCVLSYWVQAVRPGYILFELDGCNEARVSHSFPEKWCSYVCWKLTTQLKQYWDL